MHLKTVTHPPEVGCVVVPDWVVGVSAGWDDAEVVVVVVVEVVEEVEVEEASVVAAAVALWYRKVNEKDVHLLKTGYMCNVW